MSGALTEAQSTYAYAIGLAERYGLQRNAAMLRCDAGLASLDAGKLESALRAFRDSVESRSIAPMSSGFAWALGLRLRGRTAQPLHQHAAGQVHHGAGGRPGLHSVQLTPLPRN